MLGTSYGISYIKFKNDMENSPRELLEGGRKEAIFNFYNNA